MQTVVSCSILQNTDTDMFYNKNKGIQSANKTLHKKVKVIN